MCEPRLECFFPHLSEELPGRKLGKIRWEFNRAVYVLSSCFRASEEEPQGQSKKGLKKQQKEAEKAAKKAEKQAKLVSVWLKIRLNSCLGIPVFISLTEQCCIYTESVISVI